MKHLNCDQICEKESYAHMQFQLKEYVAQLVFELQP